MLTINTNEITETIKMIRDEHLDIRTITMGISLLDCADSDPKAACRKIYDKITRYAKDLVKTGEEIGRRYGIPIIHKRISVTRRHRCRGKRYHRLSSLCKDAGQSGKGDRRQLYRRLLCLGLQGIFQRG